MQNAQLIDKKSTKNKSERIIRHIKGKYPGPTVVFFGGIHGNESAGVKALKNMLETFSEDQIFGDIYGVYGNTKALSKNERFIDEDLNRLWTNERIAQLDSRRFDSAESDEQRSIFRLLNEIINKAKGPLYFIDFHTTSSETLPFITINDALINRKFSKHFPLPIVLGIEEYLEGPLLSYLNKMGYVSLGFESGQHEAPSSVKNFESFIILSLSTIGSIRSFDEVDQIFHYNRLVREANNINNVFEVIYKYHISEGENFKMKPGFVSFEKIKKGQELAISNEKVITSGFRATLFMPLYQKAGNDGFFIIRRINPFFLNLSTVLRRLRADNLLVLLPGISWHNKEQGILRADLKIARFMAKPIFHLLGYRNRQLSENHILLNNRERAAKTRLYKNENWY